MSDTVRIIEPATPGLLTRGELADYLNVGKNLVPEIIRRFGLQPVEDRFPERAVWRQVLGVEPADAEEEALLREQLQPITWVAARIGRAASTVRNKLRKGTFGYPAPITDLGNPKIDSRSRRWIPAQIRACRDGEPVPAFIPVAPIQSAVGQKPASKNAQETAPEQAIHNAFGQILGYNAEASRQRSE